jgi:hypothetical protein
VAARPERRLALRLAWAASVLLLVGMGAAGWIYRAEISAAWPPAKRLYSLLETPRGG